MLSSAAALAAGPSAAAVPTKIDLVKSDGFMLFGAFGNPGGCVNGDRLFIKAGHPQYKQMYATALAAMLSKQKITAFVHSCEAVDWYSGPTSTFNIVQAYGTLAITDE